MHLLLVLLNVEADCLFKALVKSGEKVERVPTQVLRFAATLVRRR